MPRARTNLSIDADLLIRARELAIDLSDAAEAGIRLAVDHAQQDDLTAWLKQHREAFQRNAERDRAEGLVNESLRLF